MAALGLALGGLCRGEGAPSGAAGDLADDAGGEQLPQQAKGCLRRDRDAVRQAARAVTTGLRSTGSSALGRCERAGRAKATPVASARCKPASSSRAARAAAVTQARKPAIHSIGG
jgi:hypothetical protein